MFCIRLNGKSQLRSFLVAALCTMSCACAQAADVYPDGRPHATLRLEAQDHGIVLYHGDGPDQCDRHGAREALIFVENGVYHLFYDGAGPKGWLACLATSTDLLNWKKKGPILDLGEKGELDSATASSPWVIYDGGDWHMFYIGSPNATPPPHRIPAFPYLTMKAKSRKLAGPWVKQKKVIPFRPQPQTYYSATASPGYIVKNNGVYLQFFSASTHQKVTKRTLGIARTRDLDGPWTVDLSPIVPLEEQIENSSLYYEVTNKTWFLFTNHIGISKQSDAESETVGLEYTDAVWIYWTKNLNKWDPRRKAIVLDGKNCTWSKVIIGMPSVLRVGNKLALFYDGLKGDTLPAGNICHMHRDIGLAWLDLPLVIPNAADITDR